MRLRLSGRSKKSDRSRKRRCQVRFLHFASTPNTLRFRALSFKSLNLINATPKNVEMIFSLRERTRRKALIKHHTHGIKNHIWLNGTRQNHLLNRRWCDWEVSERLIYSRSAGWEWRGEGGTSSWTLGLRLKPLFVGNIAESQVMSLWNGADLMKEVWRVKFVNFLNVYVCFELYSNSSKVNQFTRLFDQLNLRLWRWFDDSK